MAQYQQDVFQEDEELSRKKIASREQQTAVTTNYDVGYQGALVERLEQREQTTALQAIREAVQAQRPKWREKYLMQARQQLSKFTNQKQ